MVGSPQFTGDDHGKPHGLKGALEARSPNPCVLPQSLDIEDAPVRPGFA
jgi:hypothetical protein